MKKIIIIFLVGVFFLFGCAVIPSVLLGSIFTGAHGGANGALGVDYNGNFTEDIDNYESDNRISLNYKQLVSCVLGDITEGPQQCLDSHNDNGDVTLAHREYNFNIDWPEWNGIIDDNYFNEIHVLGKYTTTNYEKVGSHTETRQVTKTEYSKDCMSCKPTPKSVTSTESYEVDDYDWVHHSEIKRGKCSESDTQKCNVILEDKDVYPYQYPTFSMTDRYGLHYDEETTEISFKKTQVWEGQMLYAYSKGKILESDSNHILIQLQANGIDLLALYETENDDLSCFFGVGDIVEATEQIGMSDQGIINFSLYNSSGQYINPYLFIDRSMNMMFIGLGEGSIIYGYEDFAPDFSNLDAYINKNGYYAENCGQCTWFAKGLFIQHYGFDPMFSGNGKECARQAYNKLKSQGWTLTKNPSPGAIFSKLTGQYGHVGIVCGVNEDGSIIICDGNYNNQNDTYQEFQRLPDWGMRIVSRDTYYGKWEFCNPPA